MGKRVAKTSAKSKKNVTTKKTSEPVNGDEKTAAGAVAGAMAAESSVPPGNPGAGASPSAEQAAPAAPQAPAPPPAEQALSKSETPAPRPTGPSIPGWAFAAVVVAAAAIVIARVSRRPKSERDFSILPGSASTSQRSPLVSGRHVQRPV